MTNPKLSYFDFPGGRGEDCRIALHLAGVKFEDVRIKGPAWGDHKASMPYGAMPVLEIEGKGKLGQSNAILGFIGRGHGMHPTDSWEAARHESILASAEDLRMALAPVMKIKDDDGKARKEFASTTMQTWAANVSAHVTGPFVGGAKLNVADLKVYVLMRWFVTGGVDHVPTDVFEKFPKLTALYAAVEADPKVAEWNARFAG